MLVSAVAMADGALLVWTDGWSVILHRKRSHASAPWMLTGIKAENGRESYRKSFGLIGATIAIETLQWLRAHIGKAI
jgi:hypothetical protein